VDTGTKRLRCAEDSTMLFEDSGRPVESGASVILVLWCHDNITYTYVVVLVLLSIFGAMSRG
jgi:hypothetical protein